jgi:hypothetical protein
MTGIYAFSIWRSDGYRPAKALTLHRYLLELN